MFPELEVPLQGIGNHTMNAPRRGGDTLSALQQVEKEN